MTLPSNSSMDVFPDNTLTTYRTLLPEYIHLNGDYECALTEISIPTTWPNVRNGFLCVMHATQTTVNKRNKRTVHSALKRHNLLSGLPRGPQYFKKSNRVTPKIKCITFRRHDPSPPPTPLLDEHVNEDSEHMVDEVESESEPESGDTTLRFKPSQPPSPPPPREAIPAAAAAAAAEAEATPPPDPPTTTITSTVTIMEKGNENISVARDFPDLLALDDVMQKFYPGEREYKIIPVQSKYVSSNQALINLLNQYVSQGKDSLTSLLRKETRNNNAKVFTYNASDLKTTIHLPPNTVLRLTKDLSYQLGFGGEIFITEQKTAPQATDGNYKAHAVFVYTDIIKEAIVGDTHAPLLRRVQITGAANTIQTISFPNPIYQPLKQSAFREVIIYLRDNIGDPISFDHGEVSVVLSFRPRLNY